MKLRELEISKLAQLEFDCNEIYKLIRWHYYSMSWGLNSPALYEHTVLAFKVQWFIHKGWVYVSLDFEDTFTLTLCKRNRTTIVKQIKGVYIEDLITTLDENIEKGCSDDKYIEKVSNIYNLTKEIWQI